MKSHLEGRTQSWWQAFKNGEPWAFVPFYERFRKPVLAFLGDRVTDPEVAEELAQEVFLKIHRFRGGLDETRLESLSGWVFQVARNTLYDWWRMSRGEKAAVRSLGPEDDIEAPEAPNPVELGERKTALRRWFKMLTPSQRRAVWMWLVRGLSHEQISSMLGLSLGGVKSLIHRARLQIPEPAMA